MMELNRDVNDCSDRLGIEFRLAPLCLTIADHNLAIPCTTMQRERVG